MKVLIAGQKWFGANALQMIRHLPGVEVVTVVAPTSQDKPDRLATTAELAGVPVIPAGTLREPTVPDDLDLIVAAHSHNFISAAVRWRARHGAIGYHPSLLPRHRGRDAIRWVLRMGEAVTGGTVYRLTDTVDGGPVLDQAHVFVRPDDTAESLWQEQLGPLGLRLLVDTVQRIARDGYQAGTPQDTALATWEPALDAPPLFRPELLALGRAG